MSRDTALVKAQGLKEALLDHGVPEVSIQLVEGRPNFTGDRWDALFMVSNMAHHIVSYYRPPNLTPLLALCIEGRTDVPGPLCNGYGGWDLCYRIITFGYANHPGAGGPATINGYVIPEDSARRYTWGTEWEGGINEEDWDRRLQNPRNKLSMTMREMMGRSHAGIQDFFKLPLSAHMEHSTWAPDRKIDRKGYTQASGIGEIHRWQTPVIIPGESDTRPRNSLGQLSMSYNALMYALDHEVSHTYQAWVDSAMVSLKYLSYVYGWGFQHFTGPYDQAKFRHAWYTMVDKINASANRYAFEWFVDKVGFWPPDENDWPENARDR